MVSSKFTAIADRFGAGAYLTPLTAFMFAVLVVPLSFVIFQSFYSDGWTTDAYRRFVTENLFHQVLVNTLVISAVTSVVAVSLGYFVAYHLSQLAPRKRAIMMILVLLPFWTSILVKSFAFTVILGTNGIINSALQFVFGQEVAFQLLFNRLGVVIGLTHWLLPFAVFPILSSILSQDASLRNAAEVMGAGSLRIFWTITFPLSLPGVIASGLMVAVISMGSFVTPALLGGRRDIMMANLVDFYIRESLDWTMASTIAVILLLIASVILTLVALLRDTSPSLQR